MNRFLAITVPMFILMAGGLSAGGEKLPIKDFVVKGVLTKNDPKDARGGPMQVHNVAMKSGNVYTIDLVSTEMDAYLRLLDAKGKQLDEDDDSGNNQNSRIIFNCTKDGDYKLVATSFDANRFGSYTLTVKTTGGIPRPTTSHTQMLGKAGADFKGDFAINGKPTKLSDLNGKVVLVNFLDVRSSSCIPLLPKLAEWNKAYKADGLVIVSVTFYTSDIGQKLAFNKEDGKIVTVTKGDRKTDQAMLGAYAEYHKVDHLLMPLSKDEALAAFEAYVVNGVPQVVLIDRKGMVRMIDIGGEKSSALVEMEIKKVLAEK